MKSTLFHTHTCPLSLSLSPSPTHKPTNQPTNLFLLYCHFALSFLSPSFLPFDSSSTLLSAVRPLLHSSTPRRSSSPFEFFFHYDSAFFTPHCKVQKKFFPLFLSFRSHSLTVLCAALLASVFQIYLNGPFCPFSPFTHFSIPRHFSHPSPSHSPFLLLTQRSRKRDDPCILTLSPIPTHPPTPSSPHTQAHLLSTHSPVFDSNPTSALTLSLFLLHYRPSTID